MRCPITYDQIIQYVKEHYGYTVQHCIIARILRELGYEVRDSWHSGTAKNPKFPTDRDRKAIKEVIEELSQQGLTKC